MKIDKNILIKHRRFFHQNAECGFDLDKTQEYICSELSKIGLRPYMVGNAGVAALIGGESSDECILLRADTDALPFTEQTDLPYASDKEAMHACGHDMHAAMLLGAAEVLSKMELKRSVKLYFQSGEELLLGAAEGIKNGILKNPDACYAIGIHVVPKIDLQIGTVILPPVGVSAPAARFFKVAITGAGCHGAAPQGGIDPINCLSYLLSEYNSLIAKEIKHLGVELTVGRVYGGSAANAIADSVIIEGTLRAATNENMYVAMERFEEVTYGTVGLHRANAKIEYPGSAPALSNDRLVIDKITPALKAEIGEDRVICAESISKSLVESLGGSEDFAHFSELVPSCYMGLAAGRSCDGYIYPLHHSKVDFDEAALPYGTAALVASVIGLQ